LVFALSSFFSDSINRHENAGQRKGQESMESVARQCPDQRRFVYVVTGGHVQKDDAQKISCFRPKSRLAIWNSARESSGNYMKTHRVQRWLAYLLIGSCAFGTLSAAESNPEPPAMLTISMLTNGQQRVSWSPYPAAEQFRILSAPNFSTPFTEDTLGIISGYEWTAPISGSLGFHRLQVIPLSSNALLSATVLNRLTYGPTPDDIERIGGIGPQAFIDEQLAWDGHSESLDTDPPITNAPPPPPPFTNWIRVSATGTATATNFGIYLSARGTVYIDDVRLVAGTNADIGDNLLLNGDFEDPILAPPWGIGSTVTGSSITSSPTVDGQAASGTNCLLLRATAGTTTLTAGLWQPFATNTPTASERFTLSFSYLPYPNPGTNLLTARLSGNATIRNITLPYNGPIPPTPPPAVSPLYGRLSESAAPADGLGLPSVTNSLSELRVYHMLRAVQSKRQLYEILVQFFENHFTTEYQKLDDWFDMNYSGIITNDNKRRNLAVDLEWREHQKFRQALLDPNCTFYDLLKISIESPAMIIYLDTVLSTRTAANENYARELLELHTMGADNGYVQQDIVELAKIWTGWRVDKKSPANANDPFAPRLVDRTNQVGVWVLHFNTSTNVHNYASTKRLFTNVVIDPRFGSQFGGGQPYGLTINANAYPGTNGITEGYLVINHLANLAYTAEFICVKLCRTFVHEDFEFGIYDYTSPTLSPEAQLIKDCMTAWKTPASGDGRTGNIRSILKVIFDSALFRGHAASQQKVKTPLEFAVSAVRALRAVNTDASSYVSTTADTDGYGLITPLSRMGGMNLFNRPEPDGFSEFGRIWLSTANLCERMRFVQHLMMPSNSSLKTVDGTVNNVSNPAGLIRSKLPQASWNDPAAIVDYLIRIIYPGEGKANLDLHRTAAINFLNTTDTGAPSAFNFASHDGRLRGAVALLMCFPRSQEQ